MINKALIDEAHLNTIIIMTVLLEYISVSILQFSEIWPSVINNTDIINCQVSFTQIVNNIYVGYKVVVTNNNTDMHMYSAGPLRIHYLITGYKTKAHSSFMQ